jgi:hypothetical protein
MIQSFKPNLQNFLNRACRKVQALTKTRTFLLLPIDSASLLQTFLGNTDGNTKICILQEHPTREKNSDPTVFHRHTYNYSSKDLRVTKPFLSDERERWILITGQERKRGEREREKQEPVSLLACTAHQLVRVQDHDFVVICFLHHDALHRRCIGNN